MRAGFRRRGREDGQEPPGGGAVRGISGIEGVRGGKKEKEAEAAASDASTQSNEEIVVRRGEEGGENWIGQGRE